MIPIAAQTPDRCRNKVSVASRAPAPASRAGGRAAHGQPPRENDRKSEQYQLASGS